MTPTQIQNVSTAITTISAETGVSVADILGVMTGFCLVDEDAAVIKAGFFAETETKKDWLVNDMDAWTAEEVLTFAKEAKRALLESEQNDNIDQEYAGNVRAPK